MFCLIVFRDCSWQIPGTTAVFGSLYNRSTSGVNATVQIYRGWSGTSGRAAADEVREQLSRLLENPFFSHSKRFPTFLRFVVEQTLAGKKIISRNGHWELRYLAEMRTTILPPIQLSASQRRRFANAWPSIIRIHPMIRNCALPCLRDPIFRSSTGPRGANDPVLKEIAVAAAEVRACRRDSALPSGACRRHSPLALCHLRCGRSAVCGGGPFVAGDAPFGARFLLGARPPRKPRAPLHRRPDRILRSLFFGMPLSPPVRFTLSP